MSKKTTAHWCDWSGNSIEHLVLNETRDHINAASVIISKDGDNPYAARYEIICDPEWRVTHVSVNLVGEDLGVELSGDGNGNWHDKSGDKPELRGAIDVDISTTPFTNTLPIRRLKLGAMQTADINTVYIRLPELIVTTDAQRYTCLDPGRLYRFESLDGDFVRDIEVDSDGLVVTYPGLFRRII
ncbi:MAG: putative glycolipid-binding domain-containing protein [Thermodesulfobacteriota bacterium]